MIVNAISPRRLRSGAFARAFGYAACVSMLASCALMSRTSTVALLADPDRLILVTLDNRDTTLASRAGSTLRGYDAAAGYSVSSEARAMAMQIARTYRLREVTAWPIDPLRVHCIVYRIADGAARDTVLAELARDRRVRIAQPLNTFSTTSVAYNDPYLALQSGFKALDLAAAHAWSRGDGVRVAVIDTGLDSAHPDLAGKVIRRENFIDADAAQFARDRHGTAVAGVIAATGNNAQGIVGVAPGVKLIALKACWQLRPDADEARCNSFTLAQALAAALNAQAQVVNLSVSGPADPLLDQLIAQGVRRGVIFVGAAPSDGRADRFPVSNPGVIAVDAAGHRSGLSSAIAAPGSEILTLMPSARYDFSSGASLATAHVAGAVALLLQRDRKLTAPAIAKLLKQSERDGSINACAALAALTQRASCTDETQAHRQVEH